MAVIQSLVRPQRSDDYDVIVEGVVEMKRARRAGGVKLDYGR